MTLRALIVWLLLPLSASAGSLCGTVRDAVTAAPVQGAGVFLYRSGAYVGMYRSTDAAGAYCFDPLADGTYDLRVVVENYEAQWVLGVEVESATGVDIYSSQRLSLSAWPNPARTRTLLRVSDPGRGPLELAIFDLHGRMIRSWRAEAGGDQAIDWDLRDRRGRAVPVGQYLLKATSDRGAAVRKLFVQR